VPLRILALLRAALGIPAPASAAQTELFDRLAGEGGRNRCRFCYGLHGFACPYVDSISFDPASGKHVIVKMRPEFYRDFRDQIVYGPEDVGEVRDESAAR
jgi:hypothetical protein